MKPPRSPLRRVQFPTEHGVFVAHYSSSGLARLDFPDPSAEPAPTAASSRQVAAWHSLTRAAVKAAVDGALPAGVPPLDLSAGTAFQQRVWRELLAIPQGHCRTYGELAQRLGSPGASRAVGSACGANPIPLLVPCHRVVAAGGKLGGFSGGLDWKRRLLSAERSKLNF